MLIFWRLILGHLLADFTFQSNFINSWKRKNIWGMLAHCAMHPIAYIALTFPYLNEYWVHLGQYWAPLSFIHLKGWFCVLLIFILHFIEDEWRIFTIFRYKSPDNTLFFIWDQLIHYIAIFVFLPIGLSDMSQGLFPEKWPILLSLAVGVTHFCTVLVYFLEKDLFGADFPEFDEKYLAMAARVVLALCFLLPGSWWLVPALLWAINLFYLRYRRVIDFSWFSMSVGGGIAAVCGLMARLIYYRY